MSEAKRDLAAWLARWAAVPDEAVGELQWDCLASEEIVAFVDDALEAGARERVVAHLRQCPYCAHEAGALQRAAREFDAQVRERGVQGGMAGRLRACLRFFVEAGRGAFTRADALVPGFEGAVRMEVVSPPAWAAGVTRGGGEFDWRAAAGAVHEVGLWFEGTSGVECLFGEEEGHATVTVSCDERLAARLLGPDGATHDLEVERGAERYFACGAGYPPGEYRLAILDPET